MASRPAASGEVHLIRHAVAIDRRRWDEPDWERPLNERGFAQARALLERYHLLRPNRFLSSPALRCIQTLQPTAGDHGMAIERVSFLEEGAPPAEARHGLLAALEQIIRPEGCDSAGESGLEQGRGGTGADTATGAGGDRPAGRLMLACTHGDVLQGLIDELLADGMAFDGSARTPKSVTYVLAVADGSVQRARLIDPPPVGAR